jgi:hypothetical protein
VKACVKRNKNDAAAICEAVVRPTMRFVPVKTADRKLPWCCTVAGSGWCASVRVW